MSNNQHNFDNEPNLPFDENGKKQFGLPSDYFASFEEKLRKRMEMESELSEFPALSSVKKANSFITPADYFSKSENAIEHATELTSYTKLEAVKKPVFADLEADYVNHLNTSLKYRIELADELKSYNTLYNLDKVNSFSVTENYFEDLTLRIKDRIYVVKEIPVSILDRVLDVLFGKKLALSFGLAAIIVVSIYFYQSSNTIIDTNDCQTLACLERQEILNDQSVANFDEDQLMDLVDVKSLNKQLNAEILKTDSLQEEDFILDNVNTDQLLEEL